MAMHYVEFKITVLFFGVLGKYSKDLERPMGWGRFCWECLVVQFFLVLDLFVVCRVIVPPGIT